MKAPEFPEFRGLALEDKPLFDSLLKESEPEISELTFTNLFVWNASEPVQISEINENLLIKRTRLSDNEIYLLPPIGNQPLSDVLRELEKYETELKRLGLQYLYGLTPQRIQELQTTAIAFEPDRDDWDYVYLTRDLSELPGDKYHPKRNFIARCLSKYQCRYASIGPREIEDCLQLETKWCNLRNCSEVRGLEAENTAIKTAFERFSQLNAFGGAIYVDDELQAFTLAEQLSKETAVIHFEKANPEIEGLYQLINQWFCQKALGSFKFVNREQDLGVPGLRKAKESYYPHHMVEKGIAKLVFSPAH